MNLMDFQFKTVMNSLKTIPSTYTNIIEAVGPSIVTTHYKMKNCWRINKHCHMSYKLPRKYIYIYIAENVQNTKKIAKSEILCKIKIEIDSNQYQKPWYWVTGSLLIIIVRRLTSCAYSSRWHSHLQFSEVSFSWAAVIPLRLPEFDTRYFVSQLPTFYTWFKLSTQEVSELILVEHNIAIHEVANALIRAPLHHIN